MEDEGGDISTDCLGGDTESLLSFAPLSSPPSFFFRRFFKFVGFNYFNCFSKFNTHLFLVWKVSMECLCLGCSPSLVETNRPISPSPSLLWASTPTHNQLGTLPSQMDPEFFVVFLCGPCDGPGYLL